MFVTTVPWPVLVNLNDIIGSGHYIYIGLSFITSWRQNCSALLSITPEALN